VKLLDRKEIAAYDKAIKSVPTETKTGITVIEIRRENADVKEKTFGKKK
jgi:hypothetical protein